jgi:hypothetical protein
MNNIALALRFVRFAGLAALLSIFISACDLTTAPRFPGPDEEEKEELDPEGG